MRHVFFFFFFFFSLSGILKPSSSSSVASSFSPTSALFSALPNFSASPNGAATSFRLNSNEGSPLGSALASLGFDLTSSGNAGGGNSERRFTSNELKLQPGTASLRVDSTGPGAPVGLSLSTDSTTSCAKMRSPHLEFVQLKSLNEMDWAAAAAAAVRPNGRFAISHCGRSDGSVYVRPGSIRSSNRMDD